MPTLPTGYWIIEGLPRPPMRGVPLAVLSWSVVDGPFESKDAALAAVQRRVLRPRWVVVPARSRREAVIAAHRTLGLPAPPRHAIP
jgi:hypothetical protein